MTTRSRSHRAIRLARAAVLALATLGVLAGPAGGVARAETHRFVEPGTNELFTVPAGEQVTGVELAAGSGANSPTAVGGLGTLLEGSADFTGTVRVIVGENGSGESSIGGRPGNGWPGGGAGVEKGGGGGGYSAICPASFNVSNGTLASCLFVAGGGGGAGDEPAQITASGCFSAIFCPGAGGVFGPVSGTTGFAEGHAGPGKGGGGGEAAASGGAGGEGGTAGQGAGASAGEDGENGSEDAGGDGGRGGTSEGGGGGGGGGFRGGGGGGGGGSCGGVGETGSCPDGFAGGGGGGGGGVLFTGPGTKGVGVAGEGPNVVITTVSTLNVFAAETPASSSTGAGSATSSLSVAQASTGTVQDLAGGQGAAVALSCAGPVGSSCQLSLSLSASETLSAGRVIAVSARAAKRSRHKVEHRSVLLGRATVTLLAGQSQSIAVRLDGEGRSLLRHRHKLAAELIVTQTDVLGKQQTLATHTLSLAAAGRSKGR